MIHILRTDDTGLVFEDKLITDGKLICDNVSQDYNTECIYLYDPKFDYRRQVGMGAADKIEMEAV